MANGQYYVGLGLACGDVRHKPYRRLKEKRLGGLNQSVLGAVGDLTTVSHIINRHAIRSPTSWWLFIIILSPLRSPFLGTTVDSVNSSRGIKDSFGVSLPTCEDHRAFAAKSLESVVARMNVGEQETRRAGVCVGDRYEQNGKER
jgi:hypothetical protein